MPGSVVIRHVRAHGPSLGCSLFRRTPGGEYRQTERRGFDRSERPCHEAGENDRFLRVLLGCASEIRLSRQALTRRPKRVLISWLEARSLHSLRTSPVQPCSLRSSLNDELGAFPEPLRPDAPSEPVTGNE